MSTYDSLEFRNEDFGLTESPTEVTEKDYINAKAFLMSTSTLTGMNLYDHLARVLAKILEDRPENVIDTFEDVSNEERKTRFSAKFDTLLDKRAKSMEVQLAEIQKKLFLEPNKPRSHKDADEDAETALPNVMQLCFYFEQAGIGLNREEMIRIWLALKTLVDTHPLQSVRFWGKLFGIEHNYLVAEVEFRDGEEEDIVEEETVDLTIPSAKPEPEKTANSEFGEEEAVEVDDTPMPIYKAPPVVPKEPQRSGVNKKTFFVCNVPGQPWVKLPHVTPQQIDVSRKIKKFLTGRLDAPVISYPPFPGNEANYLRAQIARISAGTHISPTGFYQFNEEEEEELEDGAVRENVIINTEFEPISVQDLIEPGLENWVHHALYILEQGRCSWWNPVQKKNEDEEEELEEEEEAEEPPEPEVGPPLLTPLSEDKDLDGTPAWSTQLSSKLVPQFALAVVHSNLWPGAHAFATGKTFENIYIGWGHKYSAENYSPMPPPPIMTEFPSGPEISEHEDPTPEQEAAWRAAQQEAEEEEEDDGEEEGGDDDEEDD